jgi:adenosine deaminase
MVDEYEACVNNLGFTIDDIKQLALNAIESAWCGEEMKTAMRSVKLLLETNKLLNI